MNNIGYGVGVIKHDIAVKIVAPEPTGIEAVSRAVGGGVWTALCAIGAVLGCLAWAAVTTAMGAPELSVGGGFIIGLFAFIVWEGRNG